MTFLQLCQRLVIETGIADSGPATVEGNTGDMARVVNWINDAWMRLQEREDTWDWMWDEATTTAATGSSELPVANDVQSLDVLRIGNSELEYIPFDIYKRAYVTLPNGKPSGYTVKPSGAVALNAIPDQDYTVAYSYYRVPVVMVGNNDGPIGLPDNLHMILVYDALREYAEFDVAPELERKAVRNYERMLLSLGKRELDPVKAAGPIA